MGQKLTRQVRQRRDMKVGRAPMTRFSILNACIAGAFVLAVSATPVLAEKQAEKVAVFMGLDKLTGRILTFDAYIDETVRFGSLMVRPRVCYDRPPTEPAQTDAFVEVSDKQLDGSTKKIFSGWMYAASPGLNGVEHPVFDVWLYACTSTANVTRAADGKIRDASPSEISGVAKPIAPGFDIPALQSATGKPTAPAKPPKKGKPGQATPADSPDAAPADPSITADPNAPED